MRFTVEPELEKFFLSLPKTETHLHLEGAVPLSVYRRHLPSLEAKEERFEDPAFRYNSFDEFNQCLLECAMPFFNSVERYAEGAKAVFDECWGQGVRYVEISFHLGLVLGLPGVHPTEVIEAIRGQAPDGLEVRVFAGLLHCDFTDPLVNWIREAPTWENLEGFDLHGPEDLPFEEWTAPTWQAMREAGKRNRAHAGEFRGADFVAQVVRELGVKRVAHGVRAVEDPATVELLVKEEVTLDVCPISNLKLQVSGVPSLAEHPIRQLFDAGVRLTISTDDPTFFGNRLVDDYAALYLECGFRVEEIARIVRYGWEAANIAEEHRLAFVDELNQKVSLYRGN